MVQTLLDHCELVNVRTIKFSAERFGPATADKATVASDTRYVIDDDVFANRYEWTAELADENDTPVAALGATLIVEYELRDGFKPDTQAAEAVASSTGYFAAYPYVRELFQSHCARLQLDPLVLGMLMRDSPSPTPRTVTSHK